MTKEDIIIPEEFKHLFKQGTIRKLGDPCLEQMCPIVTEFNTILQQQSTKMIKAAIEFHGVGLAAPQIKINKRLIVVQIDGKWVTMVNPIVHFMGDCVTDSVEGCLSSPGLFGTVKRCNEIEVKWQDLRGNHQEAFFEGFTAFVIQHELDHTLGVLHFTKFVPNTQHWQNPNV